MYSWVSGLNFALKSLAPSYTVVSPLALVRVTVRPVKLVSWARSAVTSTSTGTVTLFLLAASWMVTSPEAVPVRRTNLLVVSPVSLSTTCTSLPHLMGSVVLMPVRVTVSVLGLLDSSSVGPA